MRRNIQKLIISVLDKAYTESGLDLSIFYQEWFKKENSYFFLFKKNLKVTNVSHAELLALIRSYTTTDDSTYHAKDIHFTSSRAFKQTLQQLLDSFKITEVDKSSVLDLLSDLYGSLLEHTVIVDSMFGSCVVSLPPHMRADLSSICGKSGYIHSAGQLILVRNSAKAKKEVFFSELRKYLHKNCTQKTEIFFVPYAHEDFAQFDRGKSSELRNGSDDVKIFMEKSHMSGERLVSIISEMRKIFSNQLEIPKSGNFRSQHRKALRDPNDQNDRILWVLLDQSVNKKDIRHPGDESFFICYEQRYINRNQIHIENQPARVAHVTFPDILAGAVISIAKSMMAWLIMRVALHRCRFRPQATMGKHI